MCVSPQFKSSKPSTRTSNPEKNYISSFPRPPNHPYTTYKIKHMETVGHIFRTPPQPFDQQPSRQFSDRSQEKWWENSHESEEASSSRDEDEDVLEGFLRKLDANGHEVIKKFVAKVERGVPIEQVLRETWQHLPRKPASRMMEKIARKMGGERDGGFVRRERGLDVDGDILNERFKVKTVNIIGSGVVKEEEAK